jgi:hypothetical protein
MPFSFYFVQGNNGNQQNCGIHYKGSVGEFASGMYASAKLERLGNYSTLLLSALEPSNLHGVIDGKHLHTETSGSGSVNLTTDHTIHVCLYLLVRVEFLGLLDWDVCWRQKISTCCW